MDEKRYNAVEPGAKRGYWDDFAEVFGPFLTGERFRAGHRGPVPLPGFYLTFHESWPLNVRAHFDGNPDAREAFRKSPEYAETFVAVLRDFAARARKERWTDAGMQIYLNNKGSLGDRSKAPWILDEPTSFWDYRALGFYADLVREALGEERRGPIRYRVDMSRPQFCRGELEGNCDLWVVNMGAFRKHPRLLADRRARYGEEHWVYGQAPGAERPAREILRWVLEAWRGGATGLVPWQTIDRSGKAMEKADPLALFVLDGSEGGETAIRETLRLKVFRRAQQDVEYLALLREKLGLSPASMRAFLDRYVDVRAPIDEGSAEAYRSLREAAAALLEGRR
jgi:hypothetical protein